MSEARENRLFPELTVVVPAKDEEESIAAVIRGCRQWTRHVLLVDGNSRDRTVEVALANGVEKVVQDGGKGKGEALRCAIPYIETAVAVFIDADGSHDPADIPKLVAPVIAGEADHVTASRLTGGSSELHGGFDEFFRLAGSAFITASINWVYGVSLSDSQNGFRALRTSTLQQLTLRENSTTIEQEMIMRTLLIGHRMAEVPSHEYSRLHGVSHIHLSKAAPRYGWCLARNLWPGLWRHRWGVGRKPVDLHLPESSLSKVEAGAS